MDLKKVKVSINECKVGDVIAQDVVNLQTGAVLWGVGHKITKASLTLGKRFECSDIYVTVDLWDNFDVSREELDYYEESEKNVKNVFSGIKETGKVGLEIINQIENVYKDNLKKNHVIVGCINRVKQLDNETCIHCLNVALLCSLIGKWMGVSNEERDTLFITGLLHDMGKAKIDTSLINKKGRLSPEEYQEIQKHAMYGKVILEKIRGIDKRIPEAVYCHHERMDGTGYPRGLKGEQIPLFARILAVADVYDNRMAEGVYKQEETPFFVMKALLREEIDKLDADVVLTFVNNIANYYLGVEAVLSNGKTGEVVFIHPHCVYRPIVKVDGEYIDLDKNRNLKIVGILKG
jgi:HD-GYP domain-containing protein (c-di-GMP phosphodiesterase class II)